MRYVRYLATIACLSIALGALVVYVFAPPYMSGKSTAFAESNPPVAVTWQELRNLDYRTGEMPPELRKLVSEGMIVRVPGFMVPLEDSADSVKEFLLIPYVMACAHVPPPPPNQLVHVKMTGAKKQKVVWDSPVWVHGHLQVTRTASPYGHATYTMTGTLVESYMDRRSTVIDGSGTYTITSRLIQDSQ